MILHILTLCIAVYTHSNDSNPVHIACESYAKPVKYDVKSCPGEVITDRKGEMARCEITLKDD